MSYAAFSLTYVRYEEGDLVGQILAFITLAPIYICVFYATVLCIRRDIHILYMGLGQGINLLVNHILKPLLNEERPEACEREDPCMVSCT